LRGHILGVDVRTGEGLLTGQDGQRYRFGPADWADRGEPARGLEVDFESEGGRALSIYPVPGAVAVTRPEFAVSAPARAPRNDRNKLIAALLAFLLGPLGIHRFYTGRTGSGIVMLVLSITVIGLFVTVPWGFIDMIRYLMMSDEEFERRYPR
jgi:TM2 domain-containing membrane protein YozV